MIIAENLKYGDPSASADRVEESAFQARLLEDIKGFPDGFNTLVGERGASLSGGQRQRVSIARAFLKDAPMPDALPVMAIVISLLEDI